MKQFQKSLLISSFSIGQLTKHPDEALLVVFLLKNERKPLFKAQPTVPLRFPQTSRFPVRQFQTVSAEHVEKRLRRQCDDAKHQVQEHLQVPPPPDVTRVVVVLELRVAAFDGAPLTVVDLLGGHEGRSLPDTGVTVDQRDMPKACREIPYPLAVVRRVDEVVETCDAVPPSST